MVQQQFLDSCGVVGREPPAEYDSSGLDVSFEKGLEKTAGRKGWVDMANDWLFRLGIQGHTRRPGQGLSATAAIPRVAAKPAADGNIRHRAHPDGVPWLIDSGLARTDLK